MSGRGDFESWVEEAAGEAAIQDRAAQKLVAKLRGDVRDAKREARLAHKDAHEADARLSYVLRLEDSPRDQVANFVPLSKARKHRNQGMPVLCLSDYHLEERVDPATVNGLNEYNPQIAQRRLEYLFEGFAWHVEMWAKSWDVTDCALWLGGDIITGYIHEELLENNWLSPIEASLKAQQLLSDGIEYLLNRCKFLERLYIPCSYGNHGRSTPRRRISTGAKNSYEWLLYNTLAQRFSRDARVTFDVAGGDLLYSELYGVQVRWHHGDNIGYQGGVGGLTIPLRKKVDAWNESRHAGVTVIGHWHTYQDYTYAVGNGSIVGLAPYAVAIGARYELPRQAGFLICAQRGRLGATPIYCDPDRKTARR